MNSQLGFGSIADGMILLQNIPKCGLQPMEVISPIKKHILDILNYDSWENFILKF
jgi:hypothetical protein